MSRRRRYVILLAALAAASVGLSFRGFWAAATAPVQAAPAHVDAVVVLTGGAARIDQALDLLHAGRADRLYVSGADDAVGVDAIAGRMPERAAALAGRIEVGHARDTAGNAAETTAWMAANDVRSALLVTAYYHMPRSLLLLREAAPGAEFWPYPVEPAAAAPANWWRSARGASVILGEWLKYVATRAGFGR